MGYLVRIRIGLSRFGLCSGRPRSISVRVRFGLSSVWVRFELIEFGSGWGLVWIGSIFEDSNSGRFGSGLVGVRIGLA